MSFISHNHHPPFTLVNQLRTRTFVQATVSCTRPKEKKQSARSLWPTKPPSPSSLFFCTGKLLHISAVCHHFSIRLLPHSRRHRTQIEYAIRRYAKSQRITADREKRLKHVYAHQQKYKACCCLLRQCITRHSPEFSLDNPFTYSRCKETR